MSLNKDSIKAFLKTDRAILMGCIGIALIVWVFMKMAQRHTTDINVEVAYQLPENKIFAESPPTSVTPEIQGTGWALFARYIRGLNPDITLDLTNRANQTISAAQLAARIRQQLPYQLEVNNPSQAISIILDDKAGKRIPLSLQKKISFAPQVQSASPPTLSPDSITIYGPASVIEQVDSWTTQPLSLDNVKENIKQELPLSVHPNKQVSFQPTVVTCTLPVEKFTEKTMELPVAVLNAPDSLLLTIHPAKVKMTCRVGLSDYDMVIPSDFDAVVDFTKVNVDDFNYVPVILSRQSELVSHLRLNPESVEFIISR